MTRVPARGTDAPPDLAPLLDQTFDAMSLYALRSAIEAHAAAAGMPHGRVEDIVICMHELATNAIRHGAGSGRARIWRLPGHLRCQVDDDGPPPDPDADRGFGGDPADEWPCEYAHGLWLVQCTTDGLHISSVQDGTHAVLTFALPPPGPRPPFRLARRGRGRRVVLNASGDLDREAGAAILAAVTGLRAAELILDLRAVVFWDSAGIAALTRLQHHVDERPPATLTIAVGPGTLRERLSHAPLEGKLTITGEDPG